jgi:D-inositol-3-phosphate glycosyltransferase
LNIDMVCAHAGGRDIGVGDLAVALARRGHEITVHTRRDDVGLPDSVPYAPGVTVEHVYAGPARPLTVDHLLPYLPQFAALLARRFSSRHPDVVHAHSWMSGLAALDGRHGVPVVQTFHARGTAEHGHPRDTGLLERIRLEARVVREAAMVIATFTGEARAYGIPPDSVHVIPCGVDVERFRPGGPAARRGNRPRVLTIGHLLPHNGMDTVIEALCHVPEAELVVAGGPERTELRRDPDAERLRRLAQARGVARRVLFTGRIPHEEVPALIRSADVVVAASWYAPSGTVAVEAMACGVPVVVSAAGAHLDTVADGVTGLHVPPREPGALAGRLRRLLTDPRLGPALAATAAARVRERHPWSRIAAETEAVYHRVIGEAIPAETA